MSTKKPNGNISDEELEALFEENSKKSEAKPTSSDKVDKIIDRARRQSSTKNVAEFTFVKFWTGVLEFATLFGVFLKQKSVDKNNNDDDKSDRS